MGLRLSEREYEEILKRRNKVRPVCISVPIADLEQDTPDGPLAAEKAQGPNSRCCIDIISYRHRLCDAEGISSKAIIDGMVLAGILPDDSPKYVKEVGFSQVKISKDEMERTEVIIGRAGV